MNGNRIEGLYTALVTPFDANGNVNEEMLRELIRFQVAAEVDGITILGTTGESPVLDFKEKEKIIIISRDEIPSSVKLMVGTGSYSTSQTIENTRQAKDLGADSVLIVAPYYNKPSQEGIYRHFKAIAEAVDIPITVYNIQGRTGINIQTETLFRLSQIPGIASVKEASGQMGQMMEVISRISFANPEFTVLSGDDLLAAPCLALGGNGLISVISNIAPKTTLELVRCGIQGEGQRAKDLHYKLYPLMKAAFIDTNPIPIKKLLNIAGVDVGECRLPLVLTEELNAYLIAFGKEHKELIDEFMLSMQCR